MFVVLANWKVMKSANGLGLQAASGRDYCEVTMKFPGDTVPKWVSFLSFTGPPPLYPFLPYRNLGKLSQLPW